MKGTPGFAYLPDHTPNGIFGRNSHAFGQVDERSGVGWSVIDHLVELPGVELCERSAPRTRLPEWGWGFSPERRVRRMRQGNDDMPPFRHGFNTECGGSARALRALDELGRLTL